MAQDPDALMAKARRGDRGAFDDLVRVFYRKVYGYARRTLGDDDSAAEVTQETFIRAWRYRSSFDAAKGSVRGWLFAIAANRTRELRPTRRSPTVSLDDAPALVAREASGLEAYARGVARAQLLAALESLEPEMREVLVLKYLSDLTYPEISAALGISVSAAKMRALRGREVLAYRLADLAESSEGGAG